jgi:hypothetical protein
MVKHTPPDGKDPPDEPNGIVVPLRRADKPVRSMIMAATLGEMADYLEACPGFPQVIEFPSWVVAADPDRAVTLVSAMTELDHAAAKLRRVARELAEELSARPRQ